MIASLYPIAGSKRKSKYNLLQPLPFQKTICCPFMGGAAKELQYAAKGFRTISGEINPNFRAIALATASDETTDYYVKSYDLARACFIQDIDLDEILFYADVNQSQKKLRKYNPEICEILDERWKSLTQSLWSSVINRRPNAGFYSFCQRTAFGNVMRLSPKQTGYNVSWHINKLRQALAFDPLQWCLQLREQGWNPEIYGDWRDAINAVDKVEDCYLMLDPPYIEDESDRKMTPCYEGHAVTTEARANTLALSIEPLRDAMVRGFLRVDLCNYYSDTLDKKVFYLADKYGYTIERHEIGICSALGNSNGRLEHGKRRNTKPRPVEYIWRFESEF